MRNKTEVIQENQVSSQRLKPNYNTLFTNDNGSCAPTAMNSKISPAAYLVALYQFIINLHSSRGQQNIANIIAHRRPDITSLVLDANAIAKLIPRIQIVIDIVWEKIKTDQEIADDTDMDAWLSNQLYPLNLPFDLPFLKIRQGLAEKKINYTDLLLQLDKAYPEFILWNSGWDQELKYWLQVNISQREKAFIGASGISVNQLLLVSQEELPKIIKQAYGITSSEEKKLSVEDFLTISKLNYQSFEELFLVANYRIKPSDNMQIKKDTFIKYYKEINKIYSANETNLNLNDSSLALITNVMRLQKWLSIPFKDLHWLMYCSQPSAVTKSENRQSSLQNTLINFGFYKYLSAKYPLKLEEFTALIYKICPYANQVEPSQFDRLFNKDGQSLFQLSMTDTFDFENDESGKAHQVVGALGGHYDSYKILNESIKQNKVQATPIEKLSIFYRFFKLGQMFKVASLEIWQLLTILSDDKNLLIKSFYIPENSLVNNHYTDNLPSVIKIILALEKLIPWLKKYNISTLELAYITGKMDLLYDKKTKTTLEITHLVDFFDSLKLAQSNFVIPERERMPFHISNDELTRILNHVEQKFNKSEEETKQQIAALESKKADFKRLAENEHLMPPSPPLEYFRQQYKLTEEEIESVKGRLDRDQQKFLRFKKIIDAAIESNGLSSWDELDKLNAAYDNFGFGNRGVIVKESDAFIEEANKKVLAFKYKQNHDAIVNTLVSLYHIDPLNAEASIQYIFSNADINRLFESLENNETFDQLIPKDQAFVLTKFELLNRYRLCVNKFQLSTKELELFNYDALNLNHTTNIDLKRVYLLGRLKDWHTSATKEESKLIDYFYNLHISASEEHQKRTEDELLTELANTLGRDKNDVSFLVAEVHAYKYGDNASASEANSKPGVMNLSLEDLDWLLRFESSSDQTGLSIQQLYRLSQANYDSEGKATNLDYSQWKQISDIFDTNESHDNLQLEVKRDALVSYFLEVIVANPSDPKVSSIKNDIDLYRYIWIDPEIAGVIKTSKVAAAIASLQTFVNTISLGNEPDVSLSTYNLKTWKTLYYRYSIWSAKQWLGLYPENYLDPMLRKDKSYLFENLESNLMQVTLNKETVEEAIYEYLNEFEKISNLEVISGYLDYPDDTNIDNLDAGVFYFVGRTRTQPYQYYWRQLDMQKDPFDNPYAWSEWKEIELPIAKEVGGIVKPIFFKDRLYIFWMEYRQKEKKLASIDQENEPEKTKAITTLQLMLGYKKFNETWSTTQNLSLHINNKEIEKNETDDPTKDPVTLALLATHLNGSWSIFAATNYEKIKENTQTHFYKIDDLLNVTEIQKPEDNLSNINSIFSQDNPNKLKIPSKIVHSRYTFERTNAYKPVKDILHYFATEDHTFSDKQIGLMNSDDDSFSFIFDTQITDDGNLKILIKSAKFEVPFRIYRNHGEFLIHDIEWVGDTPTKVIDANNVYTAEFDLNQFIKSDKSTSYQLECTIAVGIKISNIVSQKTYSYGPIKFLIKKRYTLEDSLITIQTEKIDGVKNIQELVIPEKPKIRLNTLFAKELRRANVDIANLLSLFHVTEPALVDIPQSKEQLELIKQEKLDFYGANGMYFWELLVHMPFLVSYMLNTAQRFQESQQWLNYIFNPYSANQSWWNIEILQEKDRTLPLGINIDDPDQIAIVRPSIYRKAIFRRYVQNYIDQGDALYRELTPDSLVEAKSYYFTALDLLGDRPLSATKNAFEPIKLIDANELDKNLLRAAEEAEKKLFNTHSDAPIQEQTLDASAASQSYSYFCKPINQDLFEQWDLLASRIYNLRHNLSIDGKPLNLPLFAPPTNPKDLLHDRGNQGGGGSNIGGSLEIPLYRFTAVLNKAQSAVELLTQFASHLLSLYERNETQQIEVLQLNQQSDLLKKFTLEIQNDSITLLEENKKALEISKEATTKRSDYYNALNATAAEHPSISDAFISRAINNETKALEKMRNSSILMKTSAVLNPVAGALDMAPNVFGLAVGGSQWGALPHALASSLLTISFAVSTDANALAVEGGYEWRKREWQFQSELAAQDVNQIDKQLEINQKQLDIAKKQKVQIETQQKQTTELLNFHQTRFSNQKLYQWMISQMTIAYTQAYDVVSSLCLSAQSAWQFEINDYQTQFIKPGVWNDRYKGLIVGENLKLSLLRMEQAYLRRNQRRFEITKTISLKDLMSEEEFNRQKMEGEINFNFQEKDFSIDYPGHYLRRLTSVAIFLPAVLGPYQDVKAVLTQTSSQFLIKPSVDALESLFSTDPADPGHADIKTNLRINQQIALSSGLDDSGMFVLNFGDERYLPFEGTGAVSSWQLAFPNAKSLSQQSFLKSLTDVIVRLRYTAEADNNNFKKEVEKRVKEFNDEQRQSREEQFSLQNKTEKTVDPMPNAALARSPIKKTNKAKTKIKKKTKTKASD